MEHLDNLFTAIKEKIALHITYQPFVKDPYEQAVHPYLLKEYRNRWFLIARNNENNMLSTLALDRIKSVKTAKAAYKENGLFDPVTYFNNLIGVTFPDGEEVSNVVLKVKSNQAPYIKTKPIHFTQETEAADEGSMLVRLKLINNYELRSLLLSYGADVEVLEPSGLREQMKQTFEAGLSVYST
jgi:predicted DNA-binding transcriptional regulator YafY